MLIEDRDPDMLHSEAFGGPFTHRPRGATDKGKRMLIVVYKQKQLHGSWDDLHLRDASVGLSITRICTERHANLHI